MFQEQYEGTIRSRMLALAGQTEDPAGYLGRIADELTTQDPGSILEHLLSEEVIQAFSSQNYAFDDETCEAWAKTALELQAYCKGK